MNDNMTGYRHGENLLIKIEQLPNDVEQLHTTIFSTGSHGHNHSISGGKLYKSGDDIYLEAINTSLLHPEHSPNIGNAVVKDGYYKIVHQIEYTPEGLKPVID